MQLKYLKPEWHILFSIWLKICLKLTEMIIQTRTGRLAIRNLEER